MWKSLNGYEGIYEINEYGSIRNMDGHVLSAFKTKEGYVRIGLTKNKKSRKFLVHRLVALNFLDKVRGKEEVNHKDANKENNHFSNLEWCNRKENIKHSFDNNLVYRAKGSKTYNSKLTEDIVKECRILYSNKKESIASLARKYQVNEKTMKCACVGVTWRHVQ